jgi:hypothetical protein
VWLARGGALLASLASSLPAWALVDPLPVLSRFKGKTGPDAEALPGGAEEPESGANHPPGSDATGSPTAAPGADGQLERLFGRARAADVPTGLSTFGPAIQPAPRTTAGLPATTETH